MKTENEIVELKISTADGEFVARYSEKGLCELRFPDGKKGRKEKNGAEASSQVREWHKKTVEGLKSALEGREPKKLPPIDLSAGTEFQRRVWETALGR